MVLFSTFEVRIGCASCLVFEIVKSLVFIFSTFEVRIGASCLVFEILKSLVFLFSTFEVRIGGASCLVFEMSAPTRDEHRFLTTSLSHLGEIMRVLSSGGHRPWTSAPLRNSSSVLDASKMLRTFGACLCQPNFHSSKLTYFHQVNI